MKKNVNINLKNCKALKRLTFKGLSNKGTSGIRVKEQQKKIT